MTDDQRSTPPDHVPDLDPANAEGGDVKGGTIRTTDYSTRPGDGSVRVGDGSVRVGDGSVRLGDGSVRDPGSATGG